VKPARHDTVNVCWREKDGRRVDFYFCIYSLVFQKCHSHVGVIAVAPLWNFEFFERVSTVLKIVASGVCRDVKLLVLRFEFFCLKVFFGIFF